MKRLFLCVLAVLPLFSCATVKSKPIYGDDSARDDTAYIQGLLDGPESVIRIPARDTAWIVRPLKLKGKENKTFVFEPGCVILAKKGEFTGLLDFLLDISECRNITITGYGAVFRMHKDDYMASPYKKSQWRHGIAVFKTDSLTIEGLKVQSSGGDGVYLGFRDGVSCKDIVLKHLILEDNNRQGVSVISADGLLMEDCSVFGTRGHLPQAGIDFEPNDPENLFLRIHIKNCTFQYNKGPGILIHLKNLNKDSAPVDITVENSYSAHNAFGLSVMFVPKGLEGKVRFVNSVIKGPQFISAPKGFLAVRRLQ